MMHFDTTDSAINDICIYQEVATKLWEVVHVFQSHSHTIIDESVVKQGKTHSMRGMWSPAWGGGDRRPAGGRSNEDPAWEDHCKGRTKQESARELCNFVAFVWRLFAWPGYVTIKHSIPLTVNQRNSEQPQILQTELIMLCKLQF